ncbi:hypothetical protein J4573_27925 [Actinomadura barringtoniae]|uniref:TIR domain-containing protein n=1 Tax=Actinomadura barringtoniae TaxID=1427535 RepID=A0A939TC74_9ACTN|nr:hypothetical protein [Actinomadura barringtoniae]MBO2450955.1 hypothetical protein [Actinomadura barringtoniae]
MTGGYSFFLSYAHSTPLTGERPDQLDRWVRLFFEDLRDAVQRRAEADAAGRPGPDLGSSSGSGRRDGFADFTVPVSADWNDRLLTALGAADVFVPLYSPNYFARARPRRELEAFRRRMDDAGVPPDNRVVPVLWTPPLGTAGSDWARDALAVTGPEPDYADNGLQALLRLDIYRSVFDRIVDRLAERIVEIGDTGRLRPSRVEDIDSIVLPSQDESAGRQFAVTVVADDLDWKPFPDQELSLAEYAEDVANRFDFVVDTVALPATGGLSGSPGVVLVDAEHLARPERRATVEEALRDRPPWVLPVLVGAPEATRKALTSRSLRDILGFAETVRRDVSSRVDHGVGSLKEFVEFMPFLVTEAERLYLRHGPMPQPAPDKPGSMPRLNRPPTQREDDR